MGLCMCGRFTLTVSPDTLSNLFKAEWSSPFKPRYNIAPTQHAPVVRISPTDNKLHIDLLKWGLIPSWAKDPSIGNHMINARSETVDQNLLSGMLLSIEDVLSQQVAFMNGRK